MLSSVRRAATGLIAAILWLGAALMLVLGRRSEYWIWPVTIGGLIAVAALITAALLGGAVNLRWEHAPAPPTVSAIGPADAPALMIRYGCAGCHTIPGVPGARGLVGPSLSGFGRRLYVGGAVYNDADNLVRWLVNPRAIDPRTAMPVTGISEHEARAVAAYLYRNP
jgi:cytochrome c2